MTARDRTVLLVFIALVTVAGSWFLLLAPKREEATELDGKITAVQARVQAAQATVASGEAAQSAYRGDYAAVARLGKAVPADDDVPSLVVQLEQAATASKVSFRSIELASSGAPAPAPVRAAAAVAAAQPAGATGAQGATPATAAPATSTPATGATGAAGAPVAAVSALPPGASVGAAGFPTLPFDFAFTGSFFRLQDFLARLDAFTEVRGDDITVRGRLLTVDGFALTAGPRGFPSMRASVKATAYLLPGDEGLVAGATPIAPGPVVPATPVPAGGPPAAAPAAPGATAQATGGTP